MLALYPYIPSSIFIFRLGCFPCLILWGWQDQICGTPTLHGSMACGSIPGRRLFIISLKNNMYVCVSVLHSRWLKLYGHIHQAASCIKSVKTWNYKARKAWEDMVWICGCCQYGTIIPVCCAVVFTDWYSWSFARHCFHCSPNLMDAVPFFCIIWL